MSGASVPPPPLVGFWPVVLPPFLFPCPSRVRRFGLGVWCWCFLLFPFFFWIPRLVSRLGKVSSHVHCYLIFISMSPFHPPCCGRVCVCVCHLNRCKTSHYCRGVWHSCPTTHNETADMSGKGNVPGFLCLQLFFYV